MEITKKILNCAIAVSMVLLSSSVFIYSVRNNTAMAAAPQAPRPAPAYGFVTDKYGIMWVVSYSPNEFGYYVAKKEAVIP